MARSNLLRSIAWAAIAGLLVIAAAAPAAATEGGNPPPMECDGLGLYLKIDDIGSDGIAAGTYTAGTPKVETNWPGQVVTISNVAAGGQAFDWASTELVARVVWKEADSLYDSDAGLPGLSGSVTDEIRNAISHVTFCGAAPAPTPTPTPTEPVETPTPTPTPTEPVITPTPTPTEPIITPTPTVTPSSSVEAETGTPRHTPPPTDNGAAAAPSLQAWQSLLVLVAGMLAIVLVATTPRRRHR